MSFWSRELLQGSGLRLFTRTPTTVGSPIRFYGNTVIYSTAAGKVHNLLAPKGIGQEVTIFCRRATTTLTAMVVLPTGFAFQRTSNSTGATHRKATFNAGNQSLTLVALSTSKIGIKSNTNTVIIGTS